MEGESMVENGEVGGEQGSTGKKRRTWEEGVEREGERTEENRRMGGENMEG